VGRFALFSLVFVAGQTLRNSFVAKEKEKKEQVTFCAEPFKLKNGRNRNSSPLSTLSFITNYGK